MVKALFWIRIRANKYRQNIVNVKKDLLEYLNKNKEITVAQFRDITKSNRKISIVMLEHFDRNRITKRVEDKRILY